MSDRAATINDEALAWVVRLDSQGNDPAVKAEFDRWMAGSRLHQGAFARAQSAWSGLDVLALAAGATPEQLAELTAEGSPAGDAGTVEFGGQSQERSSLLGRRAVIGTVVIGLCGLATGLVSWTGPREEASPGRPYRTAMGQILRARLDDGSVAALSSDTVIEMWSGPRRRDVKLAHGEAWFQVVKDSTRPFTVESHGLRVRAVGTAFAVRRDADGVRVLVSEGVVAMWPTADAAPIRLTAGQGVQVLRTGRAVRIEGIAEIDRALAWREGDIVLDGDTLRDAVAEFNRYNERKIVIADASLGSVKLVGRFQIEDVEGFAHAAEQLLDVRTEMTAGLITLRRRDSGTA